MNKTTIEQWRCLLALAEAGTYAKAAKHLHKTPSSVHQALYQLRERLGVELVEVNGKTSRLTSHGQALLRRAERLIKEFDDIESLAGDFSNGWEAEIGLTVESIFPSQWLMRILREFEPQCRAIRLQLYETVLSRTDDLIMRKQVDLAITPRVPPGFIGEPLINTEFIAVAAVEHPLHQIGVDITTQELASYRQFIIRDEGSQPINAGWQATDGRWTVSDFARSLACVRAGIGFGRFPKPLIQSDLDTGRLKKLPLREGHSTPIPLFLVYTDRDRAGPGVKMLAKCIQEVSKNEQENIDLINKFKWY